MSSLLRQTASAVLTRAQVRRIVSFVLVGAGATGVNTLVLWILTEAVGHFSMMSAAVAALVAKAFGFLLNDRLTWGDVTPQIVSGFARAGLYFASTSVGYGVYLLAVYALTTLGVYYLAASLAAAVIGAVFNFGASNRLTWKPRPPA